MKNLILINSFIFFSSSSYTHHEHHSYFTDTTSVNKLQTSPRLSTTAMISDIHIDYGSTCVRGRNIWTELVAYTQVWATGSHKAKRIEFERDVKIKGKFIPKDKYGFFPIPGKSEWILIKDKSWHMDLEDDYDQEFDIPQNQGKT